MATVDRDITQRSLKSFLMTKIVQRRTTTYQEIGIVLGLPTSGNALGASLAPLLGDLYRECVTNNWPHLTSIVVRKSGADVRLPGSGFWMLLEHEEQLANASRYTRKFKRQILPSFHEKVWEFLTTHYFDGYTYVPFVRESVTLNATS